MSASGRGIKYVLLTRSHDDVRPYAERLTQNGRRAMIEPMLNIERLDTTIPDLSNYQGLLFTSAQGLRIYCERSAGRDLPVYTAGPDTARRAFEEGFEKVTCSDGGLARLEPLLDLDQMVTDGRPLLHLCGADIARPLEVPGVAVDRIVLYRACPAEAFSPALLARLDEEMIDTVLFFSPRGAATFADLAARHERTARLSAIKALCISDSVLKCVQHLPWADVQVAARPGRRAMLDLL